MLLPAMHPFIVLLKLHSPPTPGRNFHSNKTDIPPVLQDINVATTADPIAVPSPNSLTDA